MYRTVTCWKKVKKAKLPTGCIDAYSHVRGYLLKKIFLSPSSAVCTWFLSLGDVILGVKSSGQRDYKTTYPRKWAGVLIRQYEAAKQLRASPTQTNNT